MRRFPLILITVLAVAAPAATAQATVCLHQPGQGAIDQYCELVPSGAGSNEASPASPASPAQAPAATVPPATQQALAGAGADGQRVEDLAKTSPAPRVHRPKHTVPAPAPVALTSDPGVLSSVGADAAKGPGGHGWLPWALVAVVLAGAGAAWWRRRSLRA